MITGSPIASVPHHRSGKHQRLAHGINLLTLPGTDWKGLIPVSCRRYDEATNGPTKNDPLPGAAGNGRAVGLLPGLCVASDSRYASLDNLEALWGYGWRWLTRLESNRLVDADGTGDSPPSKSALTPTGVRAHLQGYGFIRAFRIVPPGRDTE